MVFSPPNFKSCGNSPITQLWNIVQFVPISVYFFIVFELPMLVPSPMITSSSITVYGPIVTLFPMVTFSPTIAVGWILLEMIPSYRSTRLAKRVASATNLSFTNASPRILTVPSLNLNNFIFNTI